jgi:hypothetical protein
LFEARVPGVKHGAGIICPTELPTPKLAIDNGRINVTPVKHEIDVVLGDTEPRNDGNKAIADDGDALGSPQ